LITANFAVEQGRDVLAVPGNIYSPGSQGCNALIAQGAQPLLSPQDVLEALDLDRVAEHRTARLALPGDAREVKIFQVMGYEPIHIDEISVMAGLPVEQVSASLAMMELKGLVGKVEGMRYVRMRESGRAYLAERTS
jgi:DNA processing protein